MEDNTEVLSLTAPDVADAAVLVVQETVGEADISEAAAGVDVEPGTAILAVEVRVDAVEVDAVADTAARVVDDEADAAAVEPREVEVDVVLDTAASAVDDEADAAAVEPEVEVGVVLDTAAPAVDDNLEADTAAVEPEVEDVAVEADTAGLTADDNGKADTDVGVSVDADSPPEGAETVPAAKKQGRLSKLLQKLHLPVRKVKLEPATTVENRGREEGAGEVPAEVIKKAGFFKKLAEKRQAKADAKMAKRAAKDNAKFIKRVAKLTQKAAEAEAKMARKVAKAEAKMIEKTAKAETKNAKKTAKAERKKAKKEAKSAVVDAAEGAASRGRSFWSVAFGRRH